MKIPFNKPFMTGRELAYIAQAHQHGQLAGDGQFTAKCHKWLEDNTGSKKALLTHSCTAALEMAAILGNIGEGDEVIMPSYTFVSTANAFVMRGATPVFVDIREDTLNIDESLIEEAITPRTRAIVAVHYAGVACEMDTIMTIAQKHGLLVIEDAAQAIMCTYKGQPLGSIGDIGAFSFHETKNVISGEGGALLINREDLIERAEIIREKGTNRNQFFRGQVDKYTWVDIGSSFLPSEMVAAFLWAQLEEASEIKQERMNLWMHYHDSLEILEQRGFFRRPITPQYCSHSAHMYYLLLESKQERTSFIRTLSEHGIHSVFHYVPLHDSPYGKHLNPETNALPVTTSYSERLVRLPLWIGLGEVQQCVINTIYKAFNHDSL
ncbi:dTDP-4-amino-4,6-dideoxygalactose transaminase [Marinihelvus fidelis]|uniref:dTDP-4-amino-4,6-dideoxygalactose transaminase n=1 Tax=Marinihelvus fidelis TaxID=2613842 RepID=A0A5N0T4M6_9GAMM|nr:dTDP-4-amino-4,6-dideoxygalactose transaminase [Marinihelvus fidelis]KAA9129748.1 dTDP-4-amino-4,6-dideoxygalactose transaminase [Marinihelvus fidelis]